ncbi:Facilitated glucose transporter [Mycena kentingensis (nom. inval.)]|nr:Facilitated glucose transporter [Mycena kentingensis (nom. inval.)]
MSRPQTPTPPPPTDSELVDVKRTPYRDKPNRHTEYASRHELTVKEKNPTMPAWGQHIHESLCPQVPVNEFFSEQMKGINPNPNDIQKMVDSAATTLARVITAVAEPGLENRLYTPFANYYTALVSTWDDADRPSFVVTDNTSIPALHPTDYSSKPDITATLHGKRVAANEKQYEWIDIATNDELKSAANQDPFTEDDGHKQGVDAVEALIQVLHNPRRILMASRACYVYSVSIAGRFARFYRVDRNGCVASHAYDWTLPENKRIFAEFHWRLYNGAGPRRILGSDETVSVPTDAERERMTDIVTGLLGQNGRISRSTLKELTKHSRWVIVKVDGVERRCFTVGKPIYQSNGLFCRGTRVDCVILEPLDGDNTPPQFLVLKDSWQQACRYPESVFYRVIQDYVDNALNGEMPVGLAACLGSYDLGDDDKLAAAGHRTTTARLRKGDALQERHHRRTLLDVVGKVLHEPLDLTMREVVSALRDAIFGHKVAYEAGVMQRDVSPGNILRRLDKTGFLHDFDVSAFTLEGQKRFEDLFCDALDAGELKDLSEYDKNKKDVTGTFPFLAIDILNARWTKQPIEHEAKHDLESYLYVLLWITLRHSQHDHPSESLAATGLFDKLTVEAALLTKVSWIQGRDPARPLVSQNLPLSHLIDELCAIVDKSHSYVHTRTPVPATHDAFLAAFDKALACDDWSTELLRDFPLPKQQKEASKQSSHVPVGPLMRLTTTLGAGGPFFPDAAPPDLPRTGEKRKLNEMRGAEEPEEDESEDEPEDGLEDVLLNDDDVAEVEAAAEAARKRVYAKKMAALKKAKRRRQA